MVNFKDFSQKGVRLFAYPDDGHELAAPHYKLSKNSIIFSETTPSIFKELGF
jgi:hypothetical protein